MIYIIKIINECVDCGLPCIGSTCPYRNVISMECDNCRQEVEELYEYGGDQLCKECILSDFRQIDPEDYLKNRE